MRIARLDARGLALDDRKRLARLRGHDRRHVGLEDAGLLGGDLADGVAEMLGMIERHRGDHGRQRTLDHVGGVEPPAQADLEQQHVGRMAREQQEPRRGGDLEHRDRRARVGALAFGQRIAELIVVDEPSLARAAEPEALVEAHQMRRGVDVHAQARRLQDRAHEGDGRALAVGAGDVDHRRQLPLRMAERVENAPHPIERKIDQLWMQRGQPRDDGVDRGHECFIGAHPDWVESGCAPASLILRMSLSENRFPLFRDMR